MISFDFLAMIILESGKRERAIVADYIQTITAVGIAKFESIEDAKIWFETHRKRVDEFCDEIQKLQ